MAKDMPCNAAQDPFAQLRPSISPHDDEIACFPRRRSQDGASRIAVFGPDRLDGHRSTVGRDRPQQVERWPPCDGRVGVTRLGRMTLNRQGVIRRKSLFRHDFACSTKSHADADRGSESTPIHSYRNV